MIDCATVIHSLTLQRYYLHSSNSFLSPSPQLLVHTMANTSKNLTLPTSKTISKTRKTQSAPISTFNHTTPPTHLYNYNRRRTYICNAKTFVAQVKTRCPSGATPAFTLLFFSIGHITCSRTQFPSRICDPRHMDVLPPTWKSETQEMPSPTTCHISVARQNPFPH